MAKRELESAREAPRGLPPNRRRTLCATLLATLAGILAVRLFAAPTGARAWAAGHAISAAATSNPAPAAAGLGVGHLQGGMAGKDGAESDAGTLATAFRRHGYVLGFLLVFLGGLALNLTPCVYPLIGVTLAYFGRQGGGTRRVATLAMLYVFGITLTFSAAGVAAALSGGLFGRALESPYVLAGIATVLLVLAASSFGLLSLTPPQWMMRYAGAARPGYLGAFLMGMGMGVVAAPCIGPFVLGLLLMVEQSRNAAFGSALFFTLALGLGLPYVALALAAGSIRSLPRSGEWLRWVEQLFGFVLVGLALYFVEPLAPNRLIERLLPFYTAGAGIFLGFITSTGSSARPFKLVRVGVGTASLAALAYLFLSLGTTPAELSFEPYNEALIKTAAAKHRPVVIDFSADWCIPCREMERTTFADPAVIREAARFVRLRANLTKDDHQNQAIVDHYDVQGVPTTLFIDSAGTIRKRTVGYIGPGEFLKELRELD